MKTKITTGLILALFAAVFLYLDITWVWVIIATLAALVGYFEAHKLYARISQHHNIACSNFAKYPGALVIIVAGIYSLITPADPITLSLSSALVFAGISALAARDFSSSFALLYAFAGIYCLLDIYLFRGVSYLLWLIICVVASDSAAYFVGKAIGHLKFSPSSPNKTIEGCVGGLLAAMILGGIFASVFMQMSLGFALCSSLVFGVFGILGDLFESRLKRLAQIKDSGSFLPGHGGVLDRLDALIFAAAIARIMF